MSGGGWLVGLEPPFLHIYEVTNADIENVAVPLFPSGFDATLWGFEPFIAYYLRYVGATGWDSFYNTRYTVVFNKADVVAAQSWSSARVGASQQVVNRNRTTKHVFPYEGETVGAAFVAYRVRSITPSLFYDVPSGFPEVRFNPYPITPVGITMPQFGGHTVYEFFAVAYPKSVNVHSDGTVGEPIVQNRNKTLVVFPSDQSLYGLAKVFNYNTHLTITAGDFSVCGSHLIGYRTRIITVAPNSLPVFSVVHRIWNVIPNPPAQRLIEPSGLCSAVIPSPKFKFFTIFPEGISGFGFGAPVLTRNTIEISSRPFTLDLFGIPMLIYTRYLFHRDPYVGSEQNGVQRPRVTPHTIYAPTGTEATLQAIRNHGYPSTHRIDELFSLYSSGSHWSYGGGWPLFGRPDISNQHRVIYARSVDVKLNYVSQPTLTLSRRYVHPKPIRNLRFGLIVFLNVPQYVNLDTPNFGISSLNAFGQLAAAIPPEEVIPEAKPTPFVATLWGQNQIESLNRTVSPQGIPHSGNPQQRLTIPWGHPEAGFPRVYIWGGYDFTLWGTQWVSHRVRKLPVEGWNSLSLEGDNFTHFLAPMRVRRRNPENNIVGIDSGSAVGKPFIYNFVSSVFSRGISSYNNGNHVVKAVTTISLSGWDSLEVGNIDRWEAGKIKPHGDDLSTMGTPRLLHPLRPFGLYGGVVDAPRMGAPIRLMGIPEIGFAGPSVSNPFGCTNRVITPWPVLPQRNVPQPVVS